MINFDISNGDDILTLSVNHSWLGFIIALIFITFLKVFSYSLEEAKCIFKIVEILHGNRSSAYSQA